MKNITVSVPDDVYKKARVAAAERNLTLSGLVRQLLTEVDAETEFQKSRRRMHEILDKVHQEQRESGVFFNYAADRLSRDELHDRKKVR